MAVNSRPRAYLDWNASAPLRPEAREALLEALDRFGNPSSVHAEGREARAVVDGARDAVAAFLGCDPAEVVFTSGGTEANALAIGSLAAHAGVQRFVAAPIEHPSVLAPLSHLEAGGWEARWLPVTPEGVVEIPPDLRGEGFGVLQAANHETGALQPLEAFAAALGGTPWHCDAVQAWGRIALDLRVLGCATASLSGHKLGAPKGVGALFVRNGTPVEPLLRGGPQERGRRAGTENVPGVAALGAACQAALRDRGADARWMRGLAERLWNGLLGICPLAARNGPEEPDRRLPNTVNLSVPGLAGEVLVQALDLEGVAVSAGSACASGATEPSPVLRAMGLSAWRVEGAIRVSLGPGTRPEDVDRFLEAFAAVWARLGRPAGG
ncbi:cysteine desulfurase family protein [Deferrisoma palaeochoriense]